MKRGTRILGIISAVILVLVVGAGALRIHYVGSLTGCKGTKGVVEQTVSPDKAWEADEVVEICDIAIGSPASARIEVGRVGEDKAVVFDIDGTPDIGLQWKDSHHLTITYPRSLEIFTKDDSVDEMAIDYVAE